MNRRNFNKQLLKILLGLSLCASLPALATAATDDENLKKWNSFGETEKQEIQRRWKEFQAMPPEARARLKETYAKFSALSVDEQLLVLKNYEAWKKLTPAKKQALRQRFQEWKNLSEADKDKIRALRNKALDGSRTAE